MARFRNFLARLFRVRYITFSVKDFQVESGKVVNRLYPGKPAFIQLQIPAQRALKFEKSQAVDDFIVINYQEQPYVFEVIKVQNYYDLMTGELVEVVIIVNIPQN